ncbi:MAG: hypothetical protein ABIG66_01915 [Candidatus Kerfeldbacteria bacterium]
MAYSFYKELFLVSMQSDNIFDKPIDEMSEQELDEHVKEVQQVLDFEIGIRERLLGQLKDLQERRKKAARHEDKKKVEQLLEDIKNR